MTVWVRQIDSDVVIGEYVIQPIVSRDGGYTTTIMVGDTPKTGTDLLSIKAQSHSEKGWTVVWSGLSAFTATKVYPDSLIRQRIFEIR